MKHDEGVEGAPQSRRCAQTREIKSKDDMVRFVANLEGKIFPDVSARAPGRGVWITADASILAAAVKSNAFAKSLKAKAICGEELIENTKAALKKRCLEMLGLGRRASMVISGFEKVVSEIRLQQPALVFHAHDASLDSSRKIDGLLKDKETIITCFSVDELSNALGRENAVHICVKPGSYGVSLKAQLRRLQGFCVPP